MPLVYILTNKWYRADNMYKVGKHHSDDIDRLLSQYPPRYMPGRELIRHWIAEDCTTTEFIIHNALANTSGIERVEGEWFRGDISRILSVIENHIDRYMHDPYTLRISTENETRVYPLSVIPKEKLSNLGIYLGIHNPLDISHNKWRILQINLLFFQKRIIDMYESGADMREESRIKFSRLTGNPPDDKLLSRLYLYTKPQLSSADAHSISLSILEQPQKIQSSRISLHAAEGKVPYTYDTRQTPTSKLVQQISHEKKVHEKDYENMTVRQLHDILRKIAPRGFSYISKKEDIIKAIRNPDIILSMIEDARNRRNSKS